MTQEKEIAELKETVEGLLQTINTVAATAQYAKTQADQAQFDALNAAAKAKEAKYTGMQALSNANAASTAAMIAHNLANKAQTTANDALPASYVLGKK